MAVPVGKGGTRDLAAGPTVFFHFTVMSNELSTPKILLCPADANRVFATDFNGFGNSNISYFVGIDADDTVPQEFLAGDRNITNGSPVVNGILHLATNRPVGWTHEMHNRQGNVALADGSVQRFGNSRLNQLGSTNRLALP
jgi:prepilin-type processing-associated H-X9-DG protein